MLDEKKVSPAEAIEILESLARLEGSEGRSFKMGGRFLKIKASEDGAPEARVSVSVPIVWAKFMAPFIEGALRAKLLEKGRDMDLEKIRGALELGAPGRIVDTDGDGGRVEITIE